MGNVLLDKRADGVAMITLDREGSKVNVISRELFDEFAPILDTIERDDSIEAAVLASGKSGSFIAGADLKLLRVVAAEDDAVRFSRDGQALLDRIAASPKPVVAAVHGPALGGGLELALACHYILASDDPKTVLGLPEVTIGLLPGGGGTQRLPRRIGLTEALSLMLTGRRLRARHAYRMGLVDELSSPGGIAETAAQAALRLAHGGLRRRKPKRNPINRLLESAVLRPMVFKQARARSEARARGNYPAPGFIVDCVATGYSRGMKAGLERESELFGKLVSSAEAKNLIGLFETMNEMKKPIEAPGAEAREIKRLGVVGGGFMGSGVAAISVPLVPVTVKDISDDMLARCAAYVKGELDRRVGSGAINGFERDRLWARLQLTRATPDLAHADLIVEAVFEDLDLKRKILSEVEAVVDEKTVLASNTSALPIEEIAREARDPERVLGMHYFSPVPRMPLLEIVRTERTADWAVATAREIGIRQGKTVIVVQDGPGFYTSRILSPYLGEAMRLVEEGARVDEVDDAAKDFGFPVGPLALLDEIGIDVVAHVARNLGERFAHRGLGDSGGFARLHEAGYAGRKNRRGFYRYDDTGKKAGKKRVNQDVYAVVGGARRRSETAGRIAERLALLMVNEAVYCLDEGVIRSPRDGDVGAILGLGFPPFRGGPFRHIDALGPSAIVGTMETLRDAHGPRFEPAPMLRRLAAAKARVHP